jgi:hypothetical protein
MGEQGLMFKKLFERITGLDQVREETARAEQLLQDAINATATAQQATYLAEEEAKKAAEEAELAKLNPKERATRKKEPWVGVLDTHVNKDNIRNGFFELDWNDHFVLKLKQEGYGADGDKDEEIVDRWFRELCANVVTDGDYGGPINTGVVDMNAVKQSLGR